MRCIICGGEIDDYEEGQVPVCEKCLKAQVSKLRYIASRPKELERGYEEG